MAYHADTLNYLSRLASGGGTISTFNTDLIDTKIKQLYAYGLRGTTNYLKYWLKPNLSNTFTGSLVPVYDDGVGNPTNTNFVSGDWDSTGLKGNKIDKTLNSNWNFTTQLGSFASRYDVHIGMWLTDVVDANSYGVLIGNTASPVASPNNNDIEIYTAAGEIDTKMLSRNIAAILTKTTGLYLGNRTAINNSRLLLNNSLVASSATNATTPVDPNYPCYFLSWGAFAGSFSGARFSDAFMGFGLTPTQETNLYNILAITQPFYNYASPLMLSAC